MKRIYGFLLLLLAVILTLICLVQLGTIIKVLAAFFVTLSGKVGAYNSGYIMGALLFYAVFVAATVFSWRYGLRWIKKPTPRPTKIPDSTSF